MLQLHRIILFVPGTVGLDAFVKCRLNDSCPICSEAFSCDPADYPGRCSSQPLFASGRDDMIKRLLGEAAGESVGSSSSPDSSGSCLRGVKVSPCRHAVHLKCLHLQAGNVVGLAGILMGSCALCGGIDSLSRMRVARQGGRVEGELKSW